MLTWLPPPRSPAPPQAALGRHGAGDPARQATLRAAPVAQQRVVPAPLPLPLPAAHGTHQHAGQLTLAELPLRCARCAKHVLVSPCCCHAGGVRVCFCWRALFLTASEPGLVSCALSPAVGNPCVQLCTPRVAPPRRRRLLRHQPRHQAARRRVRCGLAQMAPRHLGTQASWLPGILAPLLAYPTAVAPPRILLHRQLLRRFLNVVCCDATAPLGTGLWVHALMPGRQMWPCVRQCSCLSEREAVRRAILPGGQAWCLGSIPGYLPGASPNPLHVREQPSAG